MSRSAIALNAALLAVATTAAAVAQTPAAALRLPKIFADGVVLQRDVAIPVWGWGAPGQSVAVSFRGRTERVTADRAGAWRVSFPAAAASTGGSDSLVVAQGASRVVVRNVAVGDVWVASGQSNMEFRLADATGGAEEVAGAHDPLLRQYKVPTSWSWEPQADLKGGSWVAADAQHAADFTAVGYYFARELRKSIGVPIAIINTSWGGSAIDPWLSRAALKLDSARWSAVQETEKSYQAGIREALRAKLGTLPTADAGLVNGRAVWADPALDDSGWSTMRVPGPWERAGLPGMDGVAWYRTSFELTAEDLTKPVRLAPGVVDDADVTYVNGVEVGRMARYGIPREYDVPASALRTGRNVVAVRVTDGGGDGGILGPPARVFVEVGGTHRSLAGEWKFRVAVVSLGEDGQHVNKIPAILYNAMLHPILPFPIRGAIWYQGESNANNDEQARAYRDQFATLITSWRREWGGDLGDFPFLWVQLPNYGAVDTVPPARSAWATIRESQSAALSLPNTGQAITIDIGEPGDIHPRNKEDVGIRLARIARSVVYGQDVVASGPTYRAHTVRDGRVIIEFDHIGGGLVSHSSGDDVAGFAIAGADGKFARAHARIEGDHMVVWGDGVTDPVAVRYAWGSSPAHPGLYNAAGLPAAPFRTDGR